MSAQLGRARGGWGVGGCGGWRPAASKAVSAGRGSLGKEQPGDREEGARRVAGALLGLLGCSRRPGRVCGGTLVREAGVEPQEHRRLEHPRQDVGELGGAGELLLVWGAPQEPGPSCSWLGLWTRSSHPAGPSAGASWARAASETDPALPSWQPGRQGRQTYPCLERPGRPLERRDS